ncbi:MAG: hypothetical protein U0J93_09830 [Parolsenella sp.]|uniref:hypothetical protein n=1 Tax=Parolsenella sp. TaxID=2083006 RepID=UPI002E76708E|nr:hypothetical protein [Parolsenella sp.]MEE1373653.1 hypothetical protein [Parolsenella sp.]
MTEEASFGVRRLRQAVANQAMRGSGKFELSIDSADRLCREIEDELARLAWAEGVPSPRDADGEVVLLDTTELYTDEVGMIYVERITFNGWSWFVWSSSGVYRLSTLHRTERDSWALLERDVLTLAKCKFLADPEGDAKECIRRAKALAGRDAKGAGRG